MRWGSVGVWRGCVVIVLGGFQFGSCVRLGRLCGDGFGRGVWLLLVGLLLLIVYEGMWLGAMRVFGGIGWAFLYGVCCWWECMFPVMLWLGGVWCLFLDLLVAGFSLELNVGFCFPGGIWSRIVSLSVTGMWDGLGRLRLWMYVFFG